MLTKESQNTVARILFSSTGFPCWALSEVFRQLPEDSVMVRHIEDPNNGCWGWIIQSKKFPNTPEGEKIPNIGVRVDGVERKVTVTIPIPGAGLMDELADL